MGLRGSPQIDVRGWVGWLMPPVLLAAGWLWLGCAHAHLKRYASGDLVCSVTSWVLGTGETELASNACGDWGYSTRDTGLSDNGKGALGEIAEGAVRGGVP